MSAVYNRRDVVSIPFRAALAICFGSFWGSHKANKAVTGDKNTNPATRRELYETSFTTGTCVAALAAFAGTALAAASQNVCMETYEKKVVKDVPLEKRPEHMKDMSAYSLGLTRRAALNSLAGGTIVASLLAPAISLFSDSGESVAEAVHGPLDKSASPDAEREITKNRAENRNMLLNALGIGGGVATGVNYNAHINGLHECMIIHLTNAISNSLSSGQPFEFTSNAFLKSKDLRTLLPCDLNSSFGIIGVTITRKGQEIKKSFVLKPDGHFEVRELSGKEHDEPVALQSSDKVLIKVY